MNATSDPWVRVTARDGSIPQVWSMRLSACHDGIRIVSRVATDSAGNPLPAKTYLKGKR